MLGILRQGPAGVLCGGSPEGCAQGRAVVKAAPIAFPSHPRHLPRRSLAAPHGTSRGARSSPPRPGPAHRRRHLNAAGCFAKSVRCWELVVLCSCCVSRSRFKMTVKAAEASGSTLTYSKMRGMVAILIGERRADFFEDAQGAVIFLSRWLNDFVSPFLLLYSFHEAEKNGTKRFHSEDSHQLLCMQAVSVRNLVGRGFQSQISLDIARSSLKIMFAYCNSCGITVTEEFICLVEVLVTSQPSP